MKHSRRGVNSYKIYSFTSGNEQFCTRKHDSWTRNVYLRVLKKDEKKISILNERRHVILPKIGMRASAWPVRWQIGWHNYHDSFVGIFDAPWGHRIKYLSVLLVALVILDLVPFVAVLRVLLGLKKGLTGYYFWWCCLFHHYP